MSTEIAHTRRWLRRRILNRLAQVFALVEPVEDDDWYRAGGTVVCEVCGWEYRDHADDPREPWMTLLCDGRRVKL